MNGRRAISGLCMACALLVSAIAAQSASAETTAFTCSESVTTKTWSDAHCDNTEGTKKYGHVAIAENKTTTITGATGTSKVTQRLKATINGIVTELSTESISGSGSMHNATTVGGKMQATGTGTITYTNVQVTAPAAKGCKVFTDSPGTTEQTEGVIHTNELKAVTDENMGLKFEPAVAGQPFATFFMTGCKGSEALEALNKTYSVTGSVTGQPTGGETVFTHATVTAEGQLKINGSIPAGIDGSLTISGRDAANEADPYKALTVTTPEGGVYKTD
jgi:hypothetical protein